MLMPTDTPQASFSGASYSVASSASVSLGAAFFSFFASFAYNNGSKQQASAGLVMGAGIWSGHPTKHPFRKRFQERNLWYMDCMGNQDPRWKCLSQHLANSVPRAHRDCLVTTWTSGCRA